MNRELISKIKKITDILWAGGVTNPITYIEQISYLIQLKRYDEKLKQDTLKDKLLKRDSITDKQTEKYRWHNWAVRSGENLRNYIITNYLRLHLIKIKEKQFHLQGFASSYKKEILIQQINYFQDTGQLMAML